MVGRKDLGVGGADNLRSEPRKTAALSAVAPRSGMATTVPLDTTVADGRVAGGVFIAKEEDLGRQHSPRHCSRSSRRRCLI